MSHRLQVLIPETMDSALAKAASRQRVTKSEWARRALAEALRRERAGGDPLARLAALRAPTADIDQMNSEIMRGRGG